MPADWLEDLMNYSSFGDLPRLCVKAFMRECLRYSVDVIKVVILLTHVYSPAVRAFLAHLWGAYAIPVALSGVRRESSVVCRLCPP